jgi:hypothetical protein
MDENLVAKIKVLAHVPVVGFPCELHVTATIIGVGIAFTVAACDRNRIPIGHTLPFTEFLNWLPPVGAFVLDRG